MSIKEMELLKENSYLKYGIISLIDSLKDKKEVFDIKNYLITLISNNQKCICDKKEKTAFEKWIEAERNLK